jgi:hypothetical protein
MGCRVAANPSYPEAADGFPSGIDYVDGGTLSVQQAVAAEFGELVAMRLQVCVPGAAGFLRWKLPVAAGTGFTLCLERKTAPYASTPLKA